MKWGSVVILVCLGIFFLFAFEIYHFYLLEKHLVRRALIVISDNSRYLPPGEQQFYEKNKKMLLPVIAWLFKVKQEEIKDTGPGDIAEKYGEPWMGKMLLTAGQGYRKEVLLTGNTATLDNLEANISDLGNRGLVVDLIIVARGNDLAYFLDGQTVNLAEVRTKLYPLHPNLGVVYLSAGSGLQHLELWREMGARVVNQPEQRSTWPVFSPGIFLTEWTNGVSFDKAVGDGYCREAAIWKTLGNFVPEAKTWAAEEASATGKTTFSGDKTLSVLNN